MQTQFIAHDGSSQAGRNLPALDPDSIAVDERSTKNLLAFAQKYARELRYFNEQNQADGDWAAFLGDNDLDDLAAFLANPGRFDLEPEKKAQFTRPHLVLFLTFLELLQFSRQQINDLTRRHLEFYYREALRLTSRKGLPDQIHALVELAGQQEQFLLPAGTLFAAGQDASGQDVFFRSDEDLVANQARLESVKSLFVQKNTVGIREARQSPDVLIELIPSNADVLGDGEPAERSFLAMLMMALGRPVPGEKLEPYPGPRNVDAALLGELDTLLAFVPGVLFMPFSTFRSLMELKNQQDNSGDQWTQVNDILETAARARLNDQTFKLDRSEPANFEKNLLAALGRPQFGNLFNQLPDVDDIYGVYRHRDRDDVMDFIAKALFMPLADFKTMMDIVEEINGRWRQVYEILRAAGRKKQLSHPDLVLQPPQIRTYEADKLNALVQRTLGVIDTSSIQGARPANLDECYAKIIQLENYFCMPAEKYAFIRAMNAGQGKTQPWEWEQVYAILEEAHSAKALAERRLALKTTNETAGFQAMLRFALGDPDPGNDLPEARAFESLDPLKDKDYLAGQLFLEPANYTYILTVESKGKKATADEWSNVYTLLELAQRRKRNWTLPPAEIERWENIYVAQDASQVQVHQSEAGPEVTPRWRAFGSGYAPQDGPAQTIPGEIGFAISSPMLVLAEGRRSITLTIGFQTDNFDADALQLAIQTDSPFQVFISTEKEMVLCENVQLRLISSPTSIPGAEKPYQRALQLVLSLDPQAPAVAPLQSAAGIQSPWPVLKILLADLPKPNSPTEGNQKRYPVFQNLALEKIHIRTEVDGIAALALQNENGSLDPKQPFEPFGLSPVAGSSFYFAHPEISTKKLDQLNLTLEWMGAPDNFNTYYLGYLKSDERETDPSGDPSTSPIVDNSKLTARLKLFDSRSSYDVGGIQLFNMKDVGSSQPHQTSIGQDAIAAADPQYQRQLLAQPGQNVLDWNRYWQLELASPDFQHSVYPKAAAGCANKIVKGTSADPKPRPYILNPPYTPKLKRLTAGYAATLEIHITKSDLAQQPERLYHIEPFGFRDLSGYPDPLYPFLPDFENQGELFIGIKNLNPPQTLSLLFQMAEGSADPNLERVPVHWSTLDGNNWSSLEEGQLLSDSTSGLLNSGILKFNLNPVGASTLLPAGQYWLRATIARNCRSVADVIGIYTSAVRATFEDHANDPQRLAQPLPAGSVSGLAEPLPQVQAIHQPFSSFGGKSPDLASSFYTRVSERLRHKNRALTSWDYEHLVLEAFPGIYKVKCLPVAVSSDPRLANAIQTVVIPDIQGKLPFDPFEPKLPADVLLQIQEYLVKHSPPFAAVQVKNPTYVRLKIRVGIRLRADGNPGFYTDLLNQELRQYLAPWAYDHSAEIVFGGRISASSIVNFIEGRSYVDYVAGLKLFTTLDGLTYTPYETNDPAQLGEVAATAADAILVSDRTHQIDLITEEGYEPEFFTGIGSMKIELDFQVAAG